jgi:hypothetical protein
MSSLDEKMSSMAELVLKRQLSEDEKNEIFRISDAMGMANVQSFLHLLMVFKLHEDVTIEQFGRLESLEARLNEKFDEMGELSAKIDKTLEASIERILGDGARAIGRDMGNDIAARACEVLSSVREFHTFRGCIVMAAFTGIISTVAYWLGMSGVLNLGEANGLLSPVLLMPAGWWMLFCLASYTYFWCFDHWYLVKRSALYKGLLALQGLVMIILLLYML